MPQHLSIYVCSWCVTGVAPESSNSSLLCLNFDIHTTDFYAFISKIAVNACMRHLRRKCIARIFFSFSFFLFNFGASTGSILGLTNKLNGDSGFGVSWWRIGRGILGSWGSFKRRDYLIPLTQIFHLEPRYPVCCEVVWQKQVFLLLKANLKLK